MGFGRGAKVFPAHEGKVPLSFDCGRGRRLWTTPCLCRALCSWRWRENKARLCFF